MQRELVILLSMVQISIMVLGVIANVEVLPGCLWQEEWKDSGARWRFSAGLSTQWRRLTEILEILLRAKPSVFLVGRLLLHEHALVCSPLICAISLS